MDSDLRRQMLAYCDQRAPEYEEAFTLGTGTSSIKNPDVFKADGRLLPPSTDAPSYGVTCSTMPSSPTPINGIAIETTWLAGQWSTASS